MSARVVKKFDNKKAAEKFARAFDYARAFNGFKPLEMKEQDGQFVILRDDARRHPVT